MKTPESWLQELKRRGESTAAEDWMFPPPDPTFDTPTWERKVQEANDIDRIFLRELSVQYKIPDI